ncbi:hypothetical protein GUITHDRAFT_147745 [Guillardia theta CCMP2712]|uniref:Uncharacterized protein n=1 Tax=Guillardia theta (strain CCMP2712) TaxID=905079 RepID=L1IBR4_GUITC|nr:hypothetical protein GUITHDRAFT_147745 [Guillardia theta CCMP2712]EKX33678.1 hypothetical protein GUITHDRAFT_147745 [Guillardia theta CCMP2712]|eukprot:XP_005820658.1 hypothetical protein GUITHDRAFT_147745 [Guillardia theta CCMP2712]
MDVLHLRFYEETSLSNRNEGKQVCNETVELSGIMLSLLCLNSALGECLQISQIEMLWQKRRTTIVTSKFHGGERVLHFEGQSEQQPADQRGARLDSYSFCQGAHPYQLVCLHHSRANTFMLQTLEGKSSCTCKEDPGRCLPALSSAGKECVAMIRDSGLSLQSNCTLVATHVGGLSPEEPAEDGITAMHCSTLVIRYSTLRGIGASKRNAAQFFAPAQVEHLAEVIARDPPPINDGSQACAEISLSPSDAPHKEVTTLQIVHRGKDQDSKVARA